MVSGVDNGFKLFVNGILVAWDNGYGFTWRWEYSGSFTPSQLKQGLNVIAVALEDHGIMTAFDMQVTATPLSLSEPPVASFTYSPDKPTVGGNIEFDASGSFDPDGTIVSYSWDFGDSTAGVGKFVSHAYTKPGRYTVTLSVRDNDGSVGGTSQVVEVGFPLRLLMISSTTGGIVLSPGEGTFQYNHGEWVILEAKADPLFKFVGWRGGFSANVNPVLLTMNADYAVKAHFESVLDVLYVDENALCDPGPGDPNISDPNENGTPEHPFDMIQEAIDVAKQGARIIVRPGTYPETIDLLVKRIEVNGLNSDDPNNRAFPVINGQGRDTVVRCTQGEDPNCILAGLVITGGKGRLAGGVLCVDSSPSIVNCLIVGNRATGPDTGGGIYCLRGKAAFVNCTISGNYGGANGAGVLFKGSLAVMTNSIVWGNGPSEILSTGDIQPVIVYTDVAGFWPGVRNLDVDPLFVAPGYWANPADLTMVVVGSEPTSVWVPGDYHLKSQAGRWNAALSAWISDVVTSECIDAGDPGSDFSMEPLPNGGRINLGAYGGTTEASKSHAP